VALDGLDKELIEKFDLSLTSQEEFGSIDNDTNIRKRKTSELFASFITGKTSEDHGIDTLSVFNKDIGKWIDVFAGEAIADKIPGGYRLRQVLKSILDVKEFKPDERFLREKSLFDKVGNSEALFVPSYNPSSYWKYGWDYSALEMGDGIEKTSNDWDEYEYSKRKRKLFRQVNTYYDFLMVHFHRPDFKQHLYDDEKKLEEIYGETDELVEKITDYFEDSFETIIFMSDHGLPTETQHNKNAFYSCNKEIFGDKEPHITDFHDVFLEKLSD
jgi:hypothetical protein